ncbi:protein mono-ADP-ribosyltransferase PARP9-like [Hyperolius riggenbachi]|uniref:protein mono-ADP-ribosyltransferase PARP9-like n=1 Tax=Hyperolius riggenbachi TaxID=752182 RepID=UPI0035A2BF89
MASPRRIPLPDFTYTILFRCAENLSDLVLKKFNCFAELSGPKLDLNQGAPYQPVKVYEKRLFGGLVISVLKGDLTREDTDVVVNAANEDLDHAGGLAYALAKAGGPHIIEYSKEWIKTHGIVKTGGIAVTRPGNLPCKCLVHAVGPVWFSDIAAKCDADLAECIKNVLQYVEKSNQKSVAIPAVSSGIFMFPLPLCAKAIVNTIHSFCYNTSSYHLKEIRLVNNDDPTVDAMKTACVARFGPSDVLSGASSASSSSSGSHSYNTGSHVQPSGARSGSSSASSYQTGPQTRSRAAQTPPTLTRQMSSDRQPSISINGFTLQLTQGLIQDQQTSVIVNSVGSNLNLSGGAVSTAILQKAGWKLQEEIKKQSSANRIMIPTRGFSLSCDRVYHVLLESYSKIESEKLLEMATFECLQQAFMNKCSSISFPALGSGNIGLQKDVVARVMTETFTKFARNRHCTMDVYFVIHPKDWSTYQAFQDQFKTYTKMLPAESAVERRDERSGFSETSSGLSETPCLVISGPDDDHIVLAESWLNSVVHHGPVTIQNNLILQLGKAEHDTLSCLGNVSIQEELKNGSSSLKIDGPAQDKIRAVIEVERLLLKVQEKHAESLEEELVAEAVAWSYENKDGKRMYPAAANRELEKAYVTQSDITLRSPPCHVINIKGLTAEGPDGVFHLQRKSVNSNTKNGQRQRSTDQWLSQTVSVPTSAQEFRDQWNKFSKEKLHLVAMEKIHNPYLSDILQSKKSASGKTRPLYQLVPRQFLKQICEVGFQTLYSNPKDPKYSPGIYFAENLKKTLEIFQTPEEEDGLLYIFQAEVLTDNISEVRRNMPVLHLKSKSADILDLYDSLVDYKMSPSFIIILNTFLANPQCLFTCRRIPSSRV